MDNNNMANNIEIERYGWKYRFSQKAGGNQFQVVPPEEYPTPKQLFKFFSLSDYSIDSILKNYLYASHPSQFNDLYDCHEELINFDDDELLFKLFAVDKETNSILAGQLKKDATGIRTFAQRNLRELVYRKWGVICLTGDPQNILMWSYYTNNQGFCVEFDFSQFPFRFHGPFPVNYQKELSQVSLKECGLPLSVLFQSNVKHYGWEPENEWRILVQAPEGESMYAPNFAELRKLGGHDRKFSYPKHAIKQVALGNRFFAPEELSPVENNMQINISAEVQKKILLLDYLVVNAVPTLIALRQSNLTNIGFVRGFLEKNGDTNYFFMTETKANP